MPPPAHPEILLIMEDGEEAHAVHVLGKYHFSNALRFSAPASKRAKEASLN
jgi:hypothetical protein